MFPIRETVRLLEYRLPVMRYQDSARKSIGGGHARYLIANGIDECLLIETLDGERGGPLDRLQCETRDVVRWCRIHVERRLRKLIGPALLMYATKRVGVESCTFTKSKPPVASRKFMS
jgi:hypothetical protein